MRERHARPIRLGKYVFQFRSRLLRAVWKARSDPFDATLPPATLLIKFPKYVNEIDVEEDGGIDDR